jgi:hypothetical protein
MAEKKESFDQKTSTTVYVKKKRRPCQQRYVEQGRSSVNKIKKAQKYANRMNQTVKIKIGNEWEGIQPR